MKEFREKIIIILTLIFLIGFVCGCSNRNSQDNIDDMHEEIEKIGIEVISESILENAISYSLKLINNSNHVIVQNNVYLSFPVSNSEKTSWSSSDWKVEAEGNRLNIDPGQEVLLNVYLSDEFFKYSELICLNKLELEIEGYLDSVDSLNQFHIGGSIHSFDSNFISKLEDIQYHDNNDYIRSLKDSYEKIGYMYYLKNNLMLEMTKAEVLELVDFEYIEMLPDIEYDVMWRFDIMKDDDYKFEIEPVTDKVDFIGLKEGSVEIILFISWDDEEKLKRFTYYYEEPVDGTINEYRVFDNGTIRESIIRGWSKE